MESIFNLVPSVIWAVLLLIVAWIAASICRNVVKKVLKRLFEKILFLADYIEPTRDFEGIDALRALAFEDLDAAMALGLKMTIEEVSRSGREVYADTLIAYEWYNKKEK